jgi:phage-related protein
MSIMKDRRASGAKELRWIGASIDDYRAFPAGAVRELGHDLWMVQLGQTPESAKPLKGFGGAGVLELVERYDGDTYRVVYTVRFKCAVYVLHAFRKKSKHGIGTPTKEIDLVRQRLRIAAEDYARECGNEA